MATTAVIPAEAANKAGAACKKANNLGLGWMYRFKQALS
jgi:hypothetical protein